MPNFWTKTTQIIYEAFKGPRTVDIEFNGKYEEIKLMVLQIKNISLTVKSFPQKLLGFKDLCSEICMHLIKPYPNDSIYYPQINAIISAHKEMINCYQECSNILGNLSGATSEWQKIFGEVKTNLKKREEARKVHDHYDEKIEKLIKEKHKKMENKEEETDEEIQKFDRVRIKNIYNIQNEAKYKRAVNDYVNLSSYTYKLMEDLASNRYKIINTMVKTFIEQERIFFGTCFSLINNFYNNMDSLQQPVPYKKTSYDPIKYTRAAKIMEGVDINSLPDIKMKDKYSFNNNQNNNYKRANSYVNNNFSSNDGNNNEIINKKFSFEDYKMRRASLDNSNKNNNINTISNNFSNINNNLNDNKQKFNPYSYEAYKKRTQSLGNNIKPQINNNNNNNYYNSNLNLVMNSIIGENNYPANNPFNDLNSNNNYSSNINNNNPFEGATNKNNLNELNNPYNNIFNKSSNNKSFMNNQNNMFNNAFGKKEKNKNDNNKFKKDPYNFGF